jgi:hypothetical protein
MNIVDQSTDTQVVIEHAMKRTPIPDEVFQRVKEESERHTQQLREKFGQTDMATDIVRESRDQ